MSAKAMNYVIHEADSRGSSRLVHLIVADVVNDAFGDEFWMSTEKISDRTRLGRTATKAAIDKLVEEGYLEVIEERPGQTTRYGFRYPTRSESDPPPVEMRLPTRSPSDPNTQEELQEDPTCGKSISEQLWDALCFACKIKSDEVTKTGRGELNAAVKELKSVGATPRDVMRRAVVWQRQYPKIAVTPSALKKHWGSLAPLDRSVVEIYPGASEEQPIGAQTLTPEEKERNQARIRELSGQFHAGLRD